MPKYDVHLYPVARVKVAGIEAASPAEAARKAEASLDLYQAVACGGAEYAEEIEGVLVDVLNESGERTESIELDRDCRPRSATGLPKGEAAWD